MKKRRDELLAEREARREERKVSINLSYQSLTYVLRFSKTSFQKQYDLTPLHSEQKVQGRCHFVY